MLSQGPLSIRIVLPKATEKTCLGQAPSLRANPSPGASVKHPMVADFSYLKLGNRNWLYSCLATSHYVKRCISICCLALNMSTCLSSQAQLLPLTVTKNFIMQVHTHLRWFRASEVAKLHGYPDWFKFPNHLTQRQRCALLGNGLSLHCVRPLLQHLLSDFTA